MNKIVLAITGGGTQAIGELLKHGGGSEWLLEAVVPYDQEAMDRFCYSVNEKYCTPETAENMAFSALRRAHLISKEKDRVVGVGITCSLKKGGERAGREHKWFGATAYYSTYLDDHGKEFTDVQYDNHYGVLEGHLSREDQELIVSQRIIGLVERAKSV